ncbi:MAG TPA: hydrogenase [Chloroflexi bacterium]|nr:hydrogenase [Chloroflexota bacterium]HHW86679.1 hydrogenase [Chloroflexota bacterium]
MILKRNFDPRKVGVYVWPQLLAALLWSAAVYVAYVVLGWSLVSVPLSVLSILGTALALFLAFRNNTAFGRWGEASQAWAAITAASRTLARLIVTFTDAHAHTPQYNAAAAETFKRAMIYRHIAWVNALRLQLRGQMDVNELAPYLDAAEVDALREAPGKPGALLLMQGRRIYDAMATGILQGFDSFQLEGQLAVLASQQAICERIKLMPVPRQYDYFTRLFVWIFILLTPLALVGTLVREGVGFWLIPLTLVLTFVFAIVQRTGEVNEDPFANQITDVPMSALCRIIERDVRATLGEHDLPPMLEPKGGYLW